MNTRRLFIIANRLPICVTSENDEVSIKVASGGLASAISSYLHNGESRFSEVFWAGMPGCSPAVWNEAANHLEGSPYTYLPVMVYKEQYEKYYNGFSNSALWPLFHYFPSFAEYNSDHYENYQFVNGRSKWFALKLHAQVLLLVIQKLNFGKLLWKEKVLSPKP